MVDRAAYPDGKVLDLAVRRIFGCQKLPSNTCLLMVEIGMLSLERIAMLGDDLATVKTTLKTLAASEDVLNAPGPCGDQALQNGTGSE